MSEVSSSAPSTRSRKVRALLAGGLVLGVGAAITLAAWNDSEYATGSFESGAFDLEGSVDGSTYDEHATAATAAPLAFSLDASNLSPGDTVTAPFAVRLDDTTTYGANVAVEPSATSGTVTGLTYSLATTSAFGCQASTADTLVPAGTSFGTEPGTANFDLAAGDGATAGDAIFLCFTVTAGEALQQGQSGTATWEFLATSDS
ncbi:SipW-dependent-type signal peptide-containing protein [Brachybacterium sp. GCM10030252]|uniref:SipW-dependent-type signal peptide-containing protein n=1 Tax=Brachybacterium sp. GCM10030252 TaxID=3273380 RepID=UPI00361B8740